MKSALRSIGQGVDLLGTVLRLVPERATPAIDVSRVRRILIVKLSSIGDVVHALPVASALKSANPALHVAWAVDDWTAPLVLGHPAVDRVIVLPTTVRWPTRPAQWVRSAADGLRQLRRDSYDVVLDLQGLARSALVSRVARAGVRLARAGQREGAHLVSRGVELPEGPIHAVEEYLTVARFAGAAPGPPRFDVPVHQDAVRRVDDRLNREGLDPTARFVVVAPSASAQWKGWPLSRWSPVVDALTTISRVVLIGTADQRAGHADLLRGSRRLAIDLTGETSLGDLVALLRRATLLVAHDSGSVHIAAALGTSVVAVYGPTNPDRLAPYGQADHVLSHRELCGPTCPAYCFRGRRCLDAISPEDVIARARLALSRHSGGS